MAIKHGTAGADTITGTSATVINGWSTALETPLEAAA